MNILEKLFGPPVPAVSPAEAQAKLKTRPAPYLLDVRQPEEYRDAHIAGAALIPLNELGQRLAELPKEREILCVCRSGNRSHAAAQQLLRAGYQAVDLRGGMLAWQSARLPVKTGMAR
ncbi:MAG: rhodanese-like domain-containing protein [Anaerolineales bacterium]|nr:rhodanese-like domain-containing protein [Anaerolineales bacterium]